MVVPPDPWLIDQPITGLYSRVGINQINRPPIKVIAFQSRLNELAQKGASHPPFEHKTLELGEKHSLTTFVRVWGKFMKVKSSNILTFLVTSDLLGNELVRHCLLIFNCIPLMKMVQIHISCMTKNAKSEADVNLAPDCSKLCKFLSLVQICPR